MSTETEFLPFNEYPSMLSRYSDSNQLQAHQYKSILESELGQTYYQRSFNDIEDAAYGPLNPNVPIRKENYNIQIGSNPGQKQNVNVFKHFWQYKQPAGSIFTDWASSGLNAVKEDMSVRDLPLHGSIKDPMLVLSNTNNVRNNFQNYGKEYLTTTNMLNSEAFINGASYSFGTSPYRSGTKFEAEQIEHGTFDNKEDGDLYQRQVKELRVDLPINYAGNNTSAWEYINVSFIVPNPKYKVFHEKLKFGTFELDSLKLVGMSCLTKEFGTIPEGFHEPVDVLDDNTEFPPVSNIDYYSKGPNRFKKEGPGNNLYCSANSNYITMPRNYSSVVKQKDGTYLDTSFQISPGNNSLMIGTVMSPKLKDFINKDLFEFNRALVVMEIFKQEIYKIVKNNPGISWKSLSPTPLMQKIRKMYPELFNKHHYMNQINFEDYSRKGPAEKYEFIFKMQRNFATIYQGHPELEIFINHLSIFKLGGKSINHPGDRAVVVLKELSNNKLPIEEQGCFLLLPTMLSEDLFVVREELPEDYSGNVNYIDSHLHKDDKLDHHEGYNCITPGANYQTNATNCAFRGPANMWQQKENPNFVPNMFNDPNNYNNDISNLDNPYSGLNPYNAPTTF